MPVVPVEENKVGIASLTDAKLRPGDFSGSGLGALGDGLQKVGGAGEELGKALATKSPAPAMPKQSTKAGEGDKRDVKSDLAKQPANTLAEQTPKQVLDDAAVKRAFNQYSEGVRSSLYQGGTALSEKLGEFALAAIPATAEQVIKTRDEAAANLTPEQHEAFHAAIAPRLDQDLNWIKGLRDTQAKVAQQQQSLRVMNNSAEDAILQYGTRAFGDHMATGLKQIDEQAAVGGWTPEAKVAAEKGFISRVHRGVSDALAVSDPVLAADHLRVFGDHMTPEDRAAAWRSLQGPLAQTQAVADLDTLAIARSATAPLTPHGDGDSLMRRMLAITPAGPGDAGENQTDAGTATNLPALLDLYGGDAAKAWAASKIGADALDALVAKQGAGWFAALPAEARTAVAADMAMLNAVSSQRGAPAPAERGELAMAIANQPWSDERKQHAFDELNTRIALEARRDKEAQDDAKEKGLGIAEQLDARFTSVNQLPPAVRDHLAPDALAALKLRADRNVHPVTVPAHGDVAMRLNRMAASDPEAFAMEDLRLHRDEMTPAEYDALDRVQKAWSGYPPGPHGVSQQRSLERVRASGLDVDSASRAPERLIDIAIAREEDQPARPKIGDDPVDPQLTPRSVPANYSRLASVESRTGSDSSSSAEQAEPIVGDLSVGTSLIAAAAAMPARRADSAPAPSGTDLSTFDTGFGGLGHGVKGDYRTTEKHRAWLAEVNRAAGPAVPYPDGSPGTEKKSREKLRQIREEVAYLYTLPEVKALLDVFAHTEVTEGDGYFRSHYPDKNKLPDLKSFHGTVPIGRYQITRKVWKDYGEDWWSRPDFSPVSQDIVAITLLLQRGVVKELTRGNLSGAFSKAAKIFASIPVSSTQDYSGYVGGKWDAKYDPKTQARRQPSPVRFNDLPALFVQRLNARREEFREAKRAWETSRTLPKAFISPMKWQSFGLDGFKPNPAPAH